MLNRLMDGQHYTTLPIIVIGTIIFGKEKHKQTNKIELNWNLVHVAVTRYLVEHGANLKAKNNDGKTAYGLISEDYFYLDEGTSDIYLIIT